MFTNMLMVSSVVLIVFAVIFITSYTQVQNENLVKLMVDSPAHAQIHLSSGIMVRDDNPVMIEQWFNPERSGQWISGVHRIAPSHISPGAGVSFSVLIDPETNVLEVDSFLNLPLETFIHITQSAVENTRNTAIVSVEGRTWQFMSFPVRIVTQASITVTSDAEVVTNLSYDEGYNFIRFLDVTESHQMLRSLALTLTGAFLAVLAVFFFISRFFAGQAVKPMEEAWEKQRRFITDASHELKTPLSVINANCGVLYSNIDEPMKEQVRWIDSISRATDRMTGLVGSLLSLANIEDNKQKLHKQTFNLSDELNATVIEMETVANEKEIQIIREIEPNITTENDKDQILKIIDILLENAVKYTPLGGTITASLTKEKRRIICTVRNTGEGISREELPNIFDRFYRGDPARSSENTGYGLGLSIAKAISTQLGAKLTAESTPGEYTEFKLLLNE